MRYSRGKRKDVVLVVPGSVKLKTVSPMLELYGYSMYSRLSSNNAASIEEMGNVGVMLY